MSTRRRTRTTIQVTADRGVFMISVAAELAEMHPQTLRMYEARGLIEPKRSPKGTRLYSQRDVERLRRIQEMTAELGLNLAGVERVLELEARLERAEKRAKAFEAEANAWRQECENAREQAATELEEALRAAKGEIVPYRRAEMVPVRTITAWVRHEGGDSAGR